MMVFRIRRQQIELSKNTADAGPDGVVVLLNKSPSESQNLKSKKYAVDFQLHEFFKKLTSTVDACPDWTKAKMSSTNPRRSNGGSCFDSIAGKN